MSVVCKHTPNIVLVRVALYDFRGMLHIALFRTKSKGVPYMQNLLDGTYCAMFEVQFDFVVATQCYKYISSFSEIC